MEWQTGKLTNKEALRNLGEMIQADPEGANHLYEVVDQIMEKELPGSAADEEMDAAWHQETHED